MQNNNFIGLDKYSTCMMQLLQSENTAHMSHVHLMSAVEALENT